MSTTFGVKIPDTGSIVEVAFRSRQINFTNDLAVMLPDETEVIPLDNSSQGIYTIGDIKKQIENQ